MGAPSGVVAALAALSSAVGGTRPLLSSGARAASRLGGSRVCVRRCDVPAREHARRPAGNRKQKGLGFVSIRLLWRLAKRAKRLRNSQNVTALNHRPRRSGSGAGTEPWTGRSTSSWRCPEPDLICLAFWQLRWRSVVLLHLHIYHTPTQQCLGALPSSADRSARLARLDHASFLAGAKFPRGPSLVFVLKNANDAQRGVTRPRPSCRGAAQTFQLRGTWSASPLPYRRSGNTRA